MGTTTRHETSDAALEATVLDATRALIQQQAALARAERLAVTGELAAGLAHDLRNPLAGVQAAISNLREELGDPSQVERLDLVLEELRRIRTRLSQVVEGARQQPEAPREVDLRDSIDSLLQLAGYQLPDAIALHRVVPEGLVCLLPEGGLRHALLNLVLNSAAAIGERPGRVEIRAERDGERLRLTVADDGPGFTEQSLSFGARPFSSWRAGGTGLGLATVGRFARDMGGTLDLANAPDGHGARITLTLPASSGRG